MKRIAIFLSMIMILSLCGCGNTENSKNETYDPYTYDSASPIAYQSGVARVWQIYDDNYLYGFIDESGKVIIPCIYDGTSNDIYEGKYIIAQKDDKYGILITDGKTLVECEYDYIYIENGSAKLEKDGEHTIMDLEIEEINKALDDVGEIIDTIEVE